jgi:hypothetical protein
MSAVVTRLEAGYERVTEQVAVPNANHHHVNREGHLVLQSSQYGDTLAVFKSWEYFVIDPPVLRGAKGRFIKKD